MPDTNEPNYYYKAALARMKYKASQCRAEATKLMTQADVYDEAANNFEDAIDREARKAAASAGDPK
jgi:hypothetical protein